MAHSSGDNFFEHRKRSPKARRQDRRFVVAFLVSLFLLLLGGGGYLVSSQIEGATLLSRISSIWSRVNPESVPPQQASLPIPLSEFPPLPQTLELQILRSPQEICERIKALGFSTEGWKQSPVNGNGWECLAERALEVNGAVKASAFFAMRGKVTTDIDSLRLKFNLPPENDGRQAYANQLAEISLFPLLDFLGWRLPSDLIEKIRNLTPFETVVRGAKLRVFHEFGSNQFVNVQLFTPRPIYPFLEIAGETFGLFVKEPNKPFTVSDHQPKFEASYNAGSDVPLERGEDGALIPQELPDMGEEGILPDEELSTDRTSFHPSHLSTGTQTLLSGEAELVPHDIGILTEFIDTFPVSQGESLIRDISIETFRFHSGRSSVYGQFPGLANQDDASFPADAPVARFRFYGENKKLYGAFVPLYD